MPSVAKRKQKNTQKAQQKKMEREKEAKKKQSRQQLPPKGQKRWNHQPATLVAPNERNDLKKVLREVAA